MLSPADRQVMVAALAPYVVLAGYDGWLHEKARRVPKVEKILHALLFLAGAVGIWMLFFDRPRSAAALLGVFVIAAAWDEFGFHGPLDAKERRLHFAAYACFAMFLGVSCWRGAFAWS